jgi:hypothetical protein
LIQAEIQLTAWQVHQFGDLGELSGLKNISFPSIQTWRLEGKNDLFNLVDLSGAHTVSFDFMQLPRSQMLSPIPTQVKTLTISNVIFTKDSIPSGQRYSLQCLASLTLEDVVFLGPMRDYLHCPILKHLEYSIFSEWSASDINAEDIESPYKHPIQETLDAVFFRETPGLQSLHLQGITLDEVLLPTLASCPALYNLRMQDCSIENFIHPFLGNLQDPKSFASLGMLVFDDQWPASLNISYREFVAQCSSRRPGVQLSKFERQGLHGPVYDDSQSDLDSMMDEDSDSSW